MAIQSVNDWLASNRQRVRLVKTASRTVVSLNNFSVLDLAGNPGAGTLAGTNTVNGGAIITDSTAGFPVLDFSTGAGILTKIEFQNSVASRLSLFDLILKMGAISYAGATTTPTADTQPDISGRCPDYPGSGSVFGARNEIWIEVSTLFATGNTWSVTVTYRNEQGTSGRVTPAFTPLALANLTLGKMFQLPLQAGDTGVQRIEAVTVTNGGTAMTAGAFNVLIMRSLWTNGRIPVANYGDVHDIFKTGAPPIYPTTALYPVVNADSTASGIFDITVDICNG